MVSFLYSIFLYGQISANGNFRPLFVSMDSPYIYSCYWKGTDRWSSFKIFLNRWKKKLVQLDRLLYIVLTICILSRAYIEISATYGIVSYMLVDRASRQLTKVSAQCIISKSNVKTVFRATECLSLFSLKQCTLKKKFRLVFCDIWSNQGRGTWKCNRSWGDYAYYSLKMNTVPFSQWRSMWRKVHLLFENSHFVSCCSTHI